MPTRTGSGLSSHSNTERATQEALDLAAEGLGAVPNLGFLFTSPDQDLGAALAAARERWPSGSFLGCATAGEFTEKGLVHGGVAAMLIAHEGSRSVAFASSVKASKTAAVDTLCATFETVRREAQAKGQRHSTTISLIDALNGAAEDIISMMRDSTTAFQQIVGGAAGDEGRFEGTPVGLNSSIGTDAAAVAHIFDSKPWGVGVDHGLTAATEMMMVTRSNANVIAEIDNRPAFEVYQEFAKGRGVDLTRENAGPFMINHEIGIFFFDEIKRARAPLSVGDDGSLTCAASVPEGSFISILDGRGDDLVAAATNAANEAKQNLGGNKAAGVLVFDCICRGAILGDRFQDEIDAIAEVFPDTPICGFLTYGEIARFKGRLDGWHNTTAVVLAIPE